MQEELTTEESEALEAMKADEQPSEPPKEQEPSAPPAEAVENTEKTEQASEPEFKSTRAEKPPEGMVPHQAMHAERVKRQEAERRLEAIEAKLAALEKPADEAPKWVDPLEDPEGHRKYEEYTAQKVNERIDAFEKQQQAQVTAQRRQMDAAAQENEFRAQTEDYDAALQHLYTETMTRIMQQGYSQQEADAQIRQQVNAIYDAATAADINFGEMLYMRAQKAGYSKAPAEDAGAKITQLADAQKKTQGLSSAGGAKQQGGLTMEAIANMSEAEFEENMQKRPAEMKRAMGG